MYRRTYDERRLSMFPNSISCMRQTATLTKRGDSPKRPARGSSCLCARCNDGGSFLEGLRAGKWHIGRYDLYYDEILDTHKESVTCDLHHAVLQDVSTTEGEGEGSSALTRPGEILKLPLTPAVIIARGSLHIERYWTSPVVQKKCGPVQCTTMMATST